MQVLSFLTYDPAGLLSQSGGQGLDRKGWKTGMKGVRRNPRSNVTCGTNLRVEGEKKQVSAKIVFLCFLGRRYGMRFGCGR